MENKNVQWIQSARDLAGSPLYPAGKVYKRHLGGVAAPPYIVTPGVWMWTAWECVTPGVHKEEVSGPFKPANKFRQ